MIAAGLSALWPLLGGLLGGSLGYAVERLVLRRAAFYPMLRGLLIVIGAAYGVALSLSVAALPPGYERRADEALELIAIGTVALVAARAAEAWIRALTREHVAILPAASLFVSLARIVVGAIGLLVALDTVGISAAPLLTAFGAGGLAVALALRDTLANLFAGVQILASRQVRPGDFVRFESGAEGYVADVTWRNTVIRDPSGASIIVPNEKMAGAIVTNFSRGGSALSLSIPFAFGLKLDLDRAEAEARAAVAEAVRAVGTGREGDPEVAIRFATVTDVTSLATITVRTSGEIDAFALRDSIIRRVHARLRAAGAATFV
jgi:small-conductance mechanosensitive channel